jgi:hypothetical protein
MIHIRIHRKNFCCAPINDEEPVWTGVDRAEWSDCEECKRLVGIWLEKIEQPEGAKDARSND